MKKKIANIIEQEALAVSKIPVTDEFQKAIDLIFENVHQKGGKIVASGMGKAGQIAENIATTFSSTGTPAVFLHPSNAQHGDLGVIQKNDILLLISNSGKTTEILQLVHLSANLYDNLPIIVISGNEESILSENANAFLYTGNPKEICPLGLSPTTSTTVMTVIGDVLVALLMEKINFSAEDYQKRHHSGYLGEKSKSLANKSLKNQKK